MSQELQGKAPLSTRLVARLSAYSRLMRLDRPIGTLLLLWPTLWALWIAGAGHPRPQVFVVFVLGVLVMRSAGCVINDIADRDIDGHVQRTRDRPLASGEATVIEALILFLALLMIALALVLTLGSALVRLAFVGAFLAASYPFLKRFTHLPQFYLGAAFGWGIPMAFAAEQGVIAPVAWWFFAANVVWAAAYDTFYAMTDREDDLKIGVKSTAVLFGRYDLIVVAALQMFTLLLLYIAGSIAALGEWYNIGLTCALGAAIYQQWIVRKRDPQRCFDAFLNNNWFGAAVFCGVLLHYTFTN